MRSGRRWVAFVVTAVVVVAMAAVTLRAYRGGHLNSLLCNGACPARYVTTPPGVGSVAAGADDAGAAGSERVDGAELQQAVAPALRSASLRTVAFAAVDARTGRLLYESNDRALMPASTTKLLTGFTALSVIDPEHRFTTRVVRSGSTLTLVGGGDPYLVLKKTDRAVDRATLTDLADRTAAQVGRGSFALHVDATLFAGRTTSATWPSTYVGSEVVSPIESLWLAPMAPGTERTTGSGDTARLFARMLKTRGVTVTGVTREAAPADAEPVAVVRSATLAQIVAEMLRTSNNDTAEVLLRHAALAQKREATFDGGVAAVRHVLLGAGVDTEGLKLVDGSGLSRSDRIRPRTLADVIWRATRSARTAAIADGLPVAGFSGTLLHRLAREPDEHGLVRAKTGTLTGVHALAGIATLSGGRPVAFAAISNTADSTAAPDTIAALDAVAAKVAGCSCGG